MIVFLDRDGVINKMGEGYITDPKDLFLIPGSGKGIKILNDLGFKTIVVTNQSIVDRGDTNHKGVRRLHDRIDIMLEEFGAEIDHYLYAWGEKTKPCKLRKPGIGMYKIAKEMYDFDPANSWIVGDNKTDIEFGQTGGLNTILVRTGDGKIWEKQCEPDFVCENLLSAAKQIKKETKNGS